MSEKDTVHVNMVETFRLLTPQSEPAFIVLRIETRDGKSFNFGLDREHFAHTVKVWNFDLNAIAGAIETGAPLSGKPFGAADKKAN
jgi:hypothetical protein